ncbi:probable RNA 2'-phosphotransferase [Toxorhynchites rutilus septentrionalis]|uniref:probable RNA 2'-phosphotransferase n=1 Tax=Toxorhynchites rutilus septentrionalis TaxID=329112 RepID=UPI0024796677|nr:probable RNA 2'-phosphotransferase [Toxorhynchites rutilus septentrionalis]XP_055640357.1 probable RNA 2'-phosphotransferase [Toxorhynchites rutilus septentrionalis]
MSDSRIPLISNEKIFFQQETDNAARHDRQANLTPQKFSWLLRHSPAVAEHMDTDAFVSFDALEQIADASKARMLEIIAEDRKGRFEIRGEEVRAVNGHSVHFCENYEIVQPPEFLYHATNNKALPLIMKGALTRMGRHFIHMYETPPPKTSVRYRLLRIRPPESHTFYKTKNGYILCREDIPAEFIEILS